MLVKERMGSGDDRTSKKRRVIGVNLERRDGGEVGVVVAMLWFFISYFLGWVWLGS